MHFRPRRFLIDPRNAGGMHPGYLANVPAVPSRTGAQKRLGLPKLLILGTFSRFVPAFQLIYKIK